MSEHGSESITVRVAGALRDVPAAEWDACAGDDNPFVSHAFLEALEASGCVRAKTGWAPYHLLVQDDDERLLGCVPLYLKGHSQGEFIFDYGWAHAYERAGGKYYPKLLSAVPFTPVTGPRLMVRPGIDRAAMHDQLTAGLVAVARQLDVSTVHVNFAPEDEWRHMGDFGLLQRTDQQFHWLNDGYETFDDFLASLSSRKRKNIRRERQAIVDAGLEIEIISGPHITEEHWEHFYRFYMDTGSRKWGRPYLNLGFFKMLGERMADRVALVMCRREGQWIAGALNLMGSDCLYGRYWGCVEDHRFLHFEVCYYQAIEHAIRLGMERVEAGAQGPHKIARGYLPVHVYSAHWIAEKRFRDAVEDYLQHERREVDDNIEYLAEFAPFRKDDETRPSD